MAVTPIVSAEQVAAVTDAYLDRMADLARRLDVPVPAVGEVTRRAGVAMVEACSREPEAIGDVLGRWAANIRALATRIRAGTTTGLPPVSTGAAASRGADTGDVAAVSSGREARATAAVLGGLDERRRLALLMRDSYDAPAGAVAVALGVSPAESQDIVAEARLRLLAGINGRPAPTLAGHEVIAGISLGTLGALADGSAQDTDPAVRLRRRHVGGCQACAAILDAQNRARVVMAGLPVLSLPDTSRQPAIDAIVSRADAMLLSAEEVDAVAVRADRVLPAAVVAVALLLALVIGVGVGAVLRHAKSSAGLSPTPTSSGVILSTATPTPTSKPSARPKTSVSAVSSDTPSFLQSYSPAAVPTSARPTPSKAKPKKTTKPKASPSHTPAPATSAPTPVSVPTDPGTQPSTTPPTPSSPPATTQPTSAAPSTSGPPGILG